MKNRGTLVVSLVSVSALMSLAGTGCLGKKSATTSDATVTPTPSSTPTTTSNGNTGTVALLNLTGPSTGTTFVCTALTLTAVDSNNVTVSSNASVAFDMVNFSSNGSFYSDAGCATPLSTGTFPEGASTLTIYFKDGVPEAGEGWATVSGSLGTAWSAALSNPRISGATYINYNPGYNAGQGAIVANSSGDPCTAIQFKFLDGNSNGLMLSPNGSTTVTISNLTANAGQFYTNNQCTTVDTNPLTIPAGNVYTSTVYFGGTHGVTTTNFTLNVTDTYGASSWNANFTIQ